MTQAEVTAKLDTLSQQSESLSEQLNAADIVLKKDEAAAIAAGKAAARARAAVTVARQNLAVSLAAQYRASSFSRTAALLSSNSGQSYLDAVESMGLIAAHQAEVAGVAASANVRSANAARAATAATASAKAERDSLVRQRDALHVQTDKYNNLLRSLTAAARAKYFAAAAASPAQVQQLALAPVPAPSKAAGVAIAAARAQLGKGYVYGASGPGAFDCSGLTSWAWSAAGISLPHNAAAQYGYGHHVTAAQLEPGDLVFFYSPISHVGIYIGGGLMIHAPTSGDVVRVAPVFAMGDFVGATRLS